MSEGVLHTIQDDSTNTIGEHWRDKVRIYVFADGRIDGSLLMR